MELRILGKKVLRTAQSIARIVYSTKSRKTDLKTKLSYDSFEDSSFPHTDINYLKTVLSNLNPKDIISGKEKTYHLAGLLERSRYLFSPDYNSMIDRIHPGMGIRRMRLRVYNGQEKFYELDFILGKEVKRDTRISSHRIDPPAQLEIKILFTPK